MARRPQLLWAQPAVSQTTPRLVVESSLAVTPETRPAPTPRRAAARNKGWLRKLHTVVGLVASLNLLLILVTGFLVQHRDAFRLDEHVISRQFLPDNYRPQDGPDGVRADIVVTDLHSGRMFGSTGALILDAVTVGWFLLLLSGLFLFAQGRWRKENGSVRNGNGGR